MKQGSRHCFTAKFPIWNKAPKTVDNLSGGGSVHGMQRVRNISGKVMIVVGLILVATNVYLQKSLKDARNRVAFLEASMGPKVGQSLKGLTGLDLNNNSVKLEYGGRTDTSLLLVLSPSCQYCDENWPYWHSLLAQNKGIPFVVLDTSGDATEEYFKSRGLALPPQILRIDSHIKEVYDLHQTPTTIVVGPGGRIEGVWIGLLSPNRVSSVTKLLQKQGGV